MTALSSGAWISAPLPSGTESAVPPADRAFATRFSPDRWTASTTNVASPPP